MSSSDGLRTSSRLGLGSGSDVERGGGEHVSLLRRGATTTTSTAGAITDLRSRVRGSERGSDGGGAGETREVGFDVDFGSGLETKRGG